MPHLNFAHKTSFPLAACPFYIIFFGDVTHCAVSRSVWRSMPLFSIGGFLSLLVISPNFSLDLARAYGTFKYVEGGDTSPPSSSAGVKHPRSSLRKKNTFINVFEDTLNFYFWYNNKMWRINRTFISASLLQFVFFEFYFLIHSNIEHFFGCHKNLYYLNIIIFLL